jgi:hypothetical protein
MGIGTSIFLIALGAIFKFAVEFDVAGIDIETIGVILMIAGVLGLLISIFLMSQARDRAAVVHRDRVVERDPLR